MFRTASLRARHSAALRRAAASTALAGALLLPYLAQAQTVPTGGVPVAGGVTIGTSQPNGNGGLVMSVRQTDARAIVNWQTFNVGRNDTVFFDHASGDAILNRVTGGTASTIAGRIAGDGSVYLINPNGIAITSTGFVTPDGGTVFSTLDISNADFIAGVNSFAGNGASANVSNAGQIFTESGGFIALLGGTVSNTGAITATMGRAGLGSGERIILDINGDNFLQVSVPTAAVTANGAALIVNGSSGYLSAQRVVLSAATAAAATRSVINVSGSLFADSSTGSAGSIILSSSGGGTVTVSSRLSARASGSSGNGGTITIAGETLSLTGMRADTSAVAGRTGTLMLRQNGSFTLAPASLQSYLTNNNVTLATGSGDLTLSGAVTWTNANALTLNSGRDISISGINASRGALNLSTGGGVRLSGMASTTGAILVDTFNLTNGNWAQNSALPSFSARDFRFDPTNATFLRVVGGNGSAATPYRITDVYGLQGLASSNLRGSNFALLANIDASGTVNWNGGTGFRAIDVFGGSLDGANTAGPSGARFAINGLTQTTQNAVGLFASLFGRVSNLDLNNVSMSTTAAVAGALVSSLGSDGRIENVSVSGRIAGGTQTGGLVGSMFRSTISNARAAVSVDTGTSQSAGGLVGNMFGGTVTGSSSSGEVRGGLLAGGLIGSASGNAIISASSASGNVFGTGFSGGLVGQVDGGASVSNSSASGAVSATGNVAGGLVGHLSSFQNGVTTGITNSFATGVVTGISDVGGLVGWQDATAGGRATISGSYATGEVRASGIFVGGLTGRTHVFGTTVGTTASITYSYATGAVSTTSGESNVYVGHVGGLVGYAYQSDASTTLSISNSYATGAVRSNADGIGGLVGTLTFGTLDNVYATGATSGRRNVGGLIGVADTGSAISNAYASGAATASDSFVGGLIGRREASAMLTNAYWDVYSTGRTNSVGNGTPGGVAVSSDPNVRSVYAAASYAFAPATGLGTTDASGFVYLPGQNTRPFLAFEVPTAARFGAVPGDLASVRTIRNSHELQLINYNAETLSGNYRLVGNIDLAETGRATVGNAASYAGMWAPTGFVSLGTDGAGNVWNGTAFVPLAANAAAYGYGGTFDGGGFALTGLTIARPTAAYSGLFGVTNGIVQNVAMTGSVSGASTTGGLVGFLYRGGRVTGSSSGATVLGSGTVVGGLIGSAGSGTLVRFSNASGTVSGTTNVGGLIGYASEAIVDRSFATGAASGTSYIGGLIGYSYLGTTIDSYARGAATASNTSAGGLIGKIVGGSVARTYSTGAVTAATRAGGLIGAADASANVNASYWDTQTSGQAVSAGGTGRTTAQLRDPATYAGWNFGTVWNAPTATTYPTLRPAAQPVP